MHCPSCTDERSPMTPSNSTENDVGTSHVRHRDQSVQRRRTPCCEKGAGQTIPHSTDVRSAPVLSSVGKRGVRQTRQKVLRCALAVSGVRVSAHSFLRCTVLCVTASSVYRCCPVPAAGARRCVLCGCRCASRSGSPACARRPCTVQCAHWSHLSPATVPCVRDSPPCAAACCRVSANQ